MADEKTGVKPGDDAPPGAAPEPRKGGRSGLAMLIVASAVVMIATPLITLMAIRLMSEPKTQKVERLATVELPLPKVQVNVAETNGTRYAQIEVVVELSDKALVPYFQDQTADNANGRLRRMRSDIIRIISSKDLAGLLTSEAKQTLAQEIREALNGQLREAAARGLVTDVYFSDYLIQ